MNAFYFTQPCLATELEFRNIQIKGKKQKRNSNLISEAVKTWCGQEALCWLTQLLINLVTAYLASHQFWCPDNRIFLIRNNNPLKCPLLFSLSDAVESCVPWAENTTQQIDLAFNIFFMVYFFIRVSGFRR